MKINSPGALIIEILQQVNQAAEKYEAKLKNNEAATRAALIDPVLRAMGWDTANPDLVEMEKLYGDTRLDYGLLGPDGKVMIILEAKSLGVNLNDPKITAKLFNYGFMYGIQNIILTDGIVWQHYQQVAPGNITPEVVNLNRDSIISCVDFFINKMDAARFWYPAPVTNPPAMVPAPLPASPTHLIPVSEQIKPTIPSKKYIPLNQLSLSDYKNQHPQSLRLPDGSMVAIKYWRDILVECAQFVLRSAPSIPIPLPDKAAKTVDLLSTIKPPDQYGFTETVYDGKKIYIYTNYDANNCILNARYILDYLPNKSSWQAVEVGI